MQSVLQFIQQNFQLMVVVLLVGSSAVGGLIRLLKEQAAKQEQRRKAERARQEMMRTGQFDANPSARGTALPPEPFQQQGSQTSRDEPEVTLDARRREQLEELRARARQREMQSNPPRSPMESPAGGQARTTSAPSAPPTNPLEVLLGLPPGSLTPQTGGQSGPGGKVSAGRGTSAGKNAAGSGQKKKKAKPAPTARDEAEARERRQRALAASARASQALGSVVGGVVSSAFTQAPSPSSGGTPAPSPVAGAPSKPRGPRARVLSRERGEMRRAFLLTQIFGPPHALRD